MSAFYCLKGEYLNISHILQTILNYSTMADNAIIFKFNDRFQWRY